jgi:hypothetical protein
MNAAQIADVRKARLELADADRPSAFLDWVLSAEPDPVEVDHVGTVFTMEALVPGGQVQYHATLHKPLPAGTKLYSGPVDATYSIDADPAGIRKRVAEAVVGALAFGAQNVRPAPAGHWLGQFWEIGRAERCSVEFVRDEVARFAPRHREAVMRASGAGALLSEILGTGMLFQHGDEDLRERVLTAVSDWESAMSQSAQPTTSATSAECSCPSGNGSLAWPCPAHPAPAEGKDAALPDGVVVSAYRIKGGILPVKAERVQQIEGPDLWAVRCGADVLSVHGEWEYEPMPSSRDDAFMARCRFLSSGAAIAAAMAQGERG